MIRGMKGAKAFEKAEVTRCARRPFVGVTQADGPVCAQDPLYVLKHGLSIDAAHYLEHHLSRPITRLFTGIVPNPGSLLRGDHTRHVSIPTPSLAAEGGPSSSSLMRFVRKTPSCLGCGVPVRREGDAVCEHCGPGQASICAQAVADASAKQARFAAFWSQCQRCQGSLHQQVICGSRDCPIFYRREKARIDMEAALERLGRFD